MRQIKFRAWDKEFKQMIEISRLEVGSTTSSWVKKPDGFDKILVFGENSELMQFTGLTDKNGKEIYEGDIVRQKNAMIDVIYLVEEINAQGTKPFHDTHPSWFEIIGNIYENPELVQGE